MPHHQSKSPEEEAALWADEFLYLTKAGRFPNTEARLQYLDEKHGGSEATEDRKKRFLRVASFLDKHRDELNHGMALIAGKDVLAVHYGLVLAIYLRLYLSKDGGAYATAQEVLDCFERLDALRKKNG